MKKIISMLLVLSLLLGFGISPVFAVEINDTIISDDLIVDIAAAEKCQALADEINEKRGLELEIGEIKPLSDFAGNEYYAIEFLPEGYAIMHGETGQRVEFSPTAVSPYCEVSGDLYYCGPTYYYYLENGVYHHVWYDEMLDSSNIESATDISTSLNAQIVTTAIETQNEPNATTYTETNLDTDDVLSYLTFSDEFGYMDGGVCGYIASGLLLLWHRYYDRNYALIDGFSYLQNDGTRFINENFTRKLRSFGSENGSSATGIVGESMKDVLVAYGNDVHITFNCTAQVDLLLSEVRNIIINQRKPVIMFGYMRKDTTESFGAHAVLAYGVTDEGHILVHYGHSYASDVELSQVTNGSRLHLNSYLINSMIFADIPQNDWAYPGAAYCARYGIIDSHTETSFGRARPTTRGMFVNALYHLAGEPAVADYDMESLEITFDDYNATYAYNKALAWAYANGIIVGTTNSLLSANDTVTREQAVTFLYRYDSTVYYYFEDCDGPGIDPETTIFTDVDDIEPYALDAMEWATTRHIIQGNQLHELVPKLTMPKEDCATMLYNFSSVASYP